MREGGEREGRWGSILQLYLQEFTVICKQRLLKCPEKASEMCQRTLYIGTKFPGLEAQVLVTVMDNISSADTRLWLQDTLQQ